MRTDSPFGTCRTCAEKVRWVETIAGKRMALDPEPSAKGNVTINTAGRAVVHGRGAAPQAPAYVCHFDHCRPGQTPASPGRPAPARGPSRAPTAIEFVDAIRSTTWTIKAGPDPMLTAVAMIHAATQVLVEGGRTVAQVQQLIERGVQ